MSASARGTSLAARLVLLYVLGSAVIMAGAGYALYHALRMQHEEQGAAEINAKAEVVQHILADIDSPESLDATMGRLGDVAVGHPNMTLGVRYGGRWLVEPADPQLAQVGRPFDHDAGGKVSEVRSQGRTWLVRTLQREWSAPAPGHVDVLVAIDTTASLALLRSHAAIAVLVALLGTLASALLAWVVTRRGLAPLAHLATRAEEVTAQRLGARLVLEEAPLELHGLADSINRMLERLEESFHMLEQFSADIAHELRTPLNNLLLQTQVTLSRPRTTEEYQEALHSNLQEIEVLQRMISEMLFLARAERGMLEAGREEIDLGAEAASVAEYFEAVAAERNQSMDVSGTATLRADRMLVRRALTNLLSNAVRYSPEGSRIAVRIAEDAGHASVEVSNPSEPVSPQELRRLFTRFARRDAARTRSREGVGLGLAIVESIMK
ncbi:MAG TPA: heavy metal sensor histidine kinase, partial [Usitatibacter sp.]|nr:heavy metal sensor histidine kinase [Usitatibacter sp.]